MSRSANPPQRRVRVWFGRHVICEYHGDADLATRYAAAMNRRFAGLRITDEPLEARRIDPTSSNQTR